MKIFLRGGCRLGIACCPGTLGPDRGGLARVGAECRPCSQPRALSGLARDRARRLRERSGRAYRATPADRDGVAAPLQRRRPRGGTVSAHGGPSPLCPEIQAALGAAVCAAQREAAGPPVAGADPKPRWTLKRLVKVFEVAVARP